MVNGAALVAAVGLVVALTGSISDAGVGGITGGRSGADGAAVAQPANQPPDVELTAGSDVIDMWRDLFSAPSSAATRIIAPTRTDGIHSIVRAVVPQLLPDDLEPGKREFLAALADRLVSPLSNVIADSRLSPYISPMVGLATDAAAFVDHTSGATPDAAAAMLDLIKMPGDALGAYHNGSNLNLGPLASMLANAGLVSEDIDPNSLYIGFSGRATSPSRGATGRFPRIGALAQIIRDVAVSFAPSPIDSY